MSDFNERWRRIAVDYAEVTLELTNITNEVLEQMGGPRVSVGQVEAFMLISEYLETKSKLSEVQQNVDYLLTMLGNIEKETNDPNIHAIIKAAKQGVITAVSNPCPYCGDDRTGKGSLIANGLAFCNEEHFDAWKTAVTQPERLLRAEDKRP